jgi:predicted helicase
MAESERFQRKKKIMVQMFQSTNIEMLQSKYTPAERNNLLAASGGGMNAEEHAAACKTERMKKEIHVLPLCQSIQLLSQLICPSSQLAFLLLFAGSAPQSLF